MILKEIHKDMSRYLKEDCYCPNEIYSPDGFFFQYFYEDEECELLGDVKESNLIYCIVEKTKNHGHAILEIKLDGDKILDVVRYDATENNIEIVAYLIKNGFKETFIWMDENKKNINGFKDGDPYKAIKEVLELFDFTMTERK